MSEKTELIPIIGTENDNRRGDVIFIHGLGGDGRGTWHPEEKKDDDNFWCFWLGEDLKHLGIWSLAYEVEPTRWKGNTMPLVERATNALSILDLEEIGERPVVFITHSMGGLLVKQMLRNALDFNNPRWQKIVEQTKGIVYLSTPHSGSDLANWTQYIKLIIRGTVSLEELKAHHPRLLELNEVYRNQERLSQIPIEVYYEKHETQGFLVVNSTSANPGIRGVTPIPVDYNHINISKPVSRKELLYRRIKRFVSECLPNNPLPPIHSDNRIPINNSPENKNFEVKDNAVFVANAKAETQNFGGTHVHLPKT
jgi:predicted alpha/beta hydrolase family esterase